MFNADELAERISEYRCLIVDALVKALWQQTIAEPEVSLLAVGGYGRGELQPYSDIDLLILADTDAPLQRAHQQISQFVTLLWDLGFEVGQSVRTLSQCVTEARKDITVITSLLESRDLCGEPKVALLEQRLSRRRFWSSRKFFTAKLEEQELRHQNFGNTSYVLEPNIKESPGGLRDLQTILWIAMRHYRVGTVEKLAALGFLDQGELETLKKSRGLLWWIRTGLHLINQRKDDILLFHHQRELATLAHYEDREEALAVEAFMKSYYRAATELRRLNEMLMQRLREQILMARRSNRSRRLGDHFQLRKAHIEVINDKVFEKHPQALLEIFLMMARFGPVINGVHADTIRLIRNHIHLIDTDFRRNPICNQLFLDFLREPYGISHGLWKMHLYGVLGAFFPDLQRVTGLMQHDLFHIYTVDEHTLKAVANVRLNSRAEWVEEMPQCHEIYQGLAKPELLILGALLHDIGKGLGGNHSRLGSAIARSFCHRLQLTSIDAQLVVWLVEAHLDMSSLSQNADIADPDVINQFASHVGSLAKLNHLYLLTIADMRATGPTVWNGWKGSLLQQLYRATRQLFETDLDAPAHPTGIEQTKQEALRLMALERVTAEQANTFWNNLELSYFSRFTSAEMAWHAKHVIPSLAEPKRPVVATRNFPERGGTGLFVYSANKPNLFAAIASCLDREGLTIVDARILTTENGFALDTFIVLDKAGELLEDIDQRRAIRHAVRRALEPEKLAPKPNQRRQDRQTKAFVFHSTVNFDRSPQPYTQLMEVTCSDRPGLLSTIAMVLSEHQVAILDARINTYGERVQDQFTILLPEDHPSEIDQQPDQLLEQLANSLTSALDPTDKQATALPTPSNK